jgi:hypothetical protein
MRNHLTEKQPSHGVPGAAFVRIVAAESQPVDEGSTVDGVTSPNRAVWDYADLGEVKGCDWITSVGDRQLVAGLNKGVIGRSGAGANARCDRRLARQTMRSLGTGFRNCLSHLCFNDGLAGGKIGQVGFLQFQKATDQQNVIVICAAKVFAVLE